MRKMKLLVSSSNDCAWKIIGEQHHQFYPNEPSQFWNFRYFLWIFFIVHHYFISCFRFWEIKCVFTLSHCPLASTFSHYPLFAWKRTLFFPNHFGAVLWCEDFWVSSGLDPCGRNSSNCLHKLFVLLGCNLLDPTGRI